MKIFVWWVVKLFAITYRSLFFWCNYVILPTFWGCRFILPKKGFSSYLLLSIMSGLYELEWRSYFDRFISSCDIFVDVGAAADGYYSLRAFKKNGNIKSFAIEPVRFELSFLVKNIIINGAVGKIIPLKVALGRDNKEIMLNNERTYMATLDSLAEKLNLPKVDVIKIDVEGMGLNVLLGAMKIIIKNKPIIFLEVHNKFEEEALQLLKSKGYHAILRGKKFIIFIPENLDLTA
ncbi:MAG: FkbM family methyltransferase [Candidatus Anstonellales archaeon]